MRLEHLGIFLTLLVLAAVSGCGSASDETADATPVSTTDVVPVPQETSTGERPKSPDEDRRHPLVTIESSLGEIVLKLDAEKAPLTVDNFLQYVDAGFYDGTAIHQAIAQYIILGGGYTPEGIEKPTRPPIRNEADNGLSNRRGTIAMARQADAIDSSTSQFFINVVDNPSLDHQNRDVEGYGYCVFGQIVKGLDVVDRIASVEVTNSGEDGFRPVEPVVIRSIRRQR